MTADWTDMDRQMRQYAIALQEHVNIIPSDTKYLASAIAEETRCLPDAVIAQLVAHNTVSLQQRLDELSAFQAFMDLMHSAPRHPGLTRAQVITQNYVCFVYLGEACFRILRKHCPSGSVTKRCCHFLTENPVRAFRNAIAHANWHYQPDFSGLVFWARKGSGQDEPLTQFQVTQSDLGFWQALARCTAYVVYSEAISGRGMRDKMPRPVAHRGTGSL